MALAGSIYRDFAGRGDERIWEEFKHHHVRLSAASAAAQERRYGPDADAALLQAGFRADEESRRLFVEEMHRAAAQAVALNLRRAAGDFSPDSSAHRFPDLPRRPSAEALKFEALFELWNEERKARGGTERTAENWRQMIEDSLASLGRASAPSIPRASRPRTFGSTRTTSAMSGA